MEPEDDGPPPGWDNKYQLNEPVEQPLKPAAVSCSSGELCTLYSTSVKQRKKFLNLIHVIHCLQEHVPLF